VTLERFGRIGTDGKPHPFHLYSMRQAIEEGFILDVLQNYTTYDAYYKLEKTIEDDPKLSGRRAQSRIARFASLDPTVIDQKIEVIVEHFLRHAAGELGGHSKGMVVTQSRELDGILLLSSSVGMWVSNVFTFSLLFWQIDRSGPEARMNDIGKRPDFLFPQTGVPDEAPLNWRPTFVDYLFLSFTTATAFSPTDTLPMTSRAKLMIMIESSISLTMIAVIAARAINIIGS
jgi:hypothetical protein